jgi:hypothetical protein
MGSVPGAAPGFNKQTGVSQLWVPICFPHILKNQTAYSGLSAQLQRPLSWEIPYKAIICGAEPSPFPSHNIRIVWLTLNLVKFWLDTVDGIGNEKISLIRVGRSHVAALTLHGSLPRGALGWTDRVVDRRRHRGRGRARANMYNPGAASSDHN